jgi:hypothetical protein
MINNDITNASVQPPAVIRANAQFLAAQPDIVRSLHRSNCSTAPVSTNTSRRLDRESTGKETCDFFLMTMQLSKKSVENLARWMNN